MRSGLKKMIQAIVILAYVSISAIAQQIPIAEDLLKRADTVLSPGDARFALRLENYESGKLEGFSEYDCYTRGLSHFLMLFKAPARLVGQAQLKVNDVIYSYNKKVDRAMQISAKTQFANSLFTQEDVMSMQLSELYTPETVTEEILDGTPAYKITLGGKTKDVAYQKIVLFVDKEKGYPIKREYFSFSGQLVKYLTVENIALDSSSRPQHLEMIMFDSIRTSKSTKAIIDITDYKSVDDNYFNRAYLKVLVK